MVDMISWEGKRDDEYVEYRIFCSHEIILYNTVMMNTLY